MHVDLHVAVQLSRSVAQRLLQFPPPQLSTHVVYVSPQVAWHVVDVEAHAGAALQAASLASMLLSAERPSDAPSLSGGALVCRSKAAKSCVQAGAPQAAAARSSAQATVFAERNERI